ADLYNTENSKQLAGTQEFADAVIERLESSPRLFSAEELQQEDIRIPDIHCQRSEKALIGVDVFVDSGGRTLKPSDMGDKVKTLESDELPLKLVTNRGGKVYPEPDDDANCADHWVCRYESKSGPIGFQEVIELLKRFHEAGLDVVKTEQLYTFDGERGYSLAQGQ
ncbi:MAG: NADP-dependent isocitrate dehydrogenase, partial [Flavobacteriales bacterium]